MIYIFTDVNKINSNLLDEMEKKLPPKRASRLRRYRFYPAKVTCAASYLVFLYGYRKLYELDGLPDFSVDDNGKPFIENLRDIYFNISHCNDGVACIFGSRPVGVDIQDIRPYKENVGRRVCSTDQQNAIVNSSDADREFTRIWTIKEAVTKINGDGIFRDVRNITENDAHTFTAFIEPNMYITGAVELSDQDTTDYSVQKKDTEFEIRYLSLNDILSL